MLIHICIHLKLRRFRRASKNLDRRIITWKGIIITFVVIVIIIIIILASLLSTIDSFKSITVILKLVGIPLMMMICYQMTITASQVDCFSWIWMVLNFLWMMFTWSLQSSPFGQ